MANRNDDEYIRKELKAALHKELDYIDEKRQIEEEAKLLFGDNMSKTMHSITDARNEAYGSGKGNYRGRSWCFLEGIRIHILYR